jgi:hypothetical protein
MVGIRAELVPKISEKRDGPILCIAMHVILLLSCRSFKKLSFQFVNVYHQSIFLFIAILSEFLVTTAWDRFLKWRVAANVSTKRRKLVVFQLKGWVEGLTTTHRKNKVSYEILHRASCGLF